MHERMSHTPGAPLEPTGNAMLSNMGPAAYANRANVPDLTVDGRARIVPMRDSGGYHVNPRDPNPIGMTVVGVDGVAAGTVADVWVDRAEPGPRYLEVRLADETRNVLLPITCTRIKAGRREVHVRSIRALHFAQVPSTARPDRVTLLEEDQIMAFFAGGYLYAATTIPELGE